MAREKQEGGSRTNWFAFWGFVLFVGLIWLSFETVVMVSLAMPPTAVAWIIDRSHQKSATFCVAGMNFCGLFPHLMDFWHGTHSMVAALDIITNVFVLLSIYGAAAFGWMLYVAVPPVVGTFLTVMAQRRVAQLRTLQRQILEEWGESVARAAMGDEDPSAASESAPPTLF